MKCQAHTSARAPLSSTVRPHEKGHRVPRGHSRRRLAAASLFSISLAYVGSSTQPIYPRVRHVGRDLGGRDSFGRGYSNTINLAFASRGSLALAGDCRLCCWIRTVRIVSTRDTHSTVCTADHAHQRRPCEYVCGRRWLDMRISMLVHHRLRDAA